MGYRQKADGMASGKGVRPSLLVRPVGKPQVRSLSAALRQIVVKTAAPDDNAVRTEMFQNFEKCRLGGSELSCRRCPPRAGHRDLHVVVEHHRVPQLRLTGPVQLLPGQSPLELGVGILIGLELRVRIQQVPYHIDRQPGDIVLRLRAIMALAQHQYLPPDDAALIPAAHPRLEMHMRQDYACCFITWFMK